MFEPKRKGGNGKIFNFSWELGSDGKFKNEKSNQIELNVPNSFENRSHMCSFTLKGKQYIIGGYGNEDISEVRRQYLVEGNEVKELEKLPFQFRNGQCVNYDDEQVLLTAAWNQHETWIFNGSSYRHLETKTYLDHDEGGLVRYNFDGKNGALIITGQSDLNQ
jgi:hypothetical protein